MECMAVKRNERAFDHARDLIAVGKYVIDDRDAWSEHQPSARQENDYIERHGIAEYARWHLGIDDEVDENRKGRYKFPYGDFQDVHRCGLLAAESRSGQRKYYDRTRGGSPAWHAGSVADVGCHAGSFMIFISTWLGRGASASSLRRGWAKHTQ
jgi:hypothetical protein